MKKPDRLLQYLRTAVPLFAQQPDLLSMLVRSGNVVAAGAASLSHELAYTLQIVCLDFPADLHVLTVPTLAWLRTEQPDLMDNPERRVRGVRFEAQINGTGKVDVYIELDLTERILVQRLPNNGPSEPEGTTQPDADTVLERWIIRPVPEPARTGLLPEHWQIIDPDGTTVLAEWDIPAERV